MFKELGYASVKLMVFSDASFRSNSHITSQVGYVITNTDKEGTSNVIHYYRKNSDMWLEVS